MGVCSRNHTEKKVEPREESEMTRERGQGGRSHLDVVSGKRDIGRGSMEGGSPRSDPQSREDVSHVLSRNLFRNTMSSECVCASMSKS